MAKNAVYSWRLKTDLKIALEEAARRERQSVAELLDRIAREWLRQATQADAEEEQRRLHAAAAAHVGSIQGDDPDRAANVRRLVRARLARRHAG